MAYIIKLTCNKPGENHLKRAGLMPDQTIQKLYYSISQISELTEVEPHVLRYWETEFKELSPRKNRSGKRLYREADIKVIRLIKTLLYEDRFTIEGARRRLMRSNRNEDSRTVSPELQQKLAEVKHGLEEIRHLLGSSE